MQVPDMIAGRTSDIPGRVLDLRVNIVDRIEWRGERQLLGDIVDPPVEKLKLLQNIAQYMFQGSPPSGFRGGATLIEMNEAGKYFVIGMIDQTRRRVRIPLTNRQSAPCPISRSVGGSESLLERELPERWGIDIDVPMFNRKWCPIEDKDGNSNRWEIWVCLP